MINRAVNPIEINPTKHNKKILLLHAEELTIVSVILIAMYFFFTPVKL